MDKIIDKWYADKCGVVVNNDHRRFRPKGGIHHGYLWSITDPRCREIIRERFSIDTLTHYIGSHKFRYCKWYKGNAKFMSETAKAEQTIAEAEIACLTAIYEQEK